jgi:Ca2+-binding EF-hand superfamily protein
LAFAVNTEEIDALHAHFRSIASSQTDDGQIDRGEFREAMGLSESLFVDRLFQLFDENDDGMITFQEFICGLSVLCIRGTLEEKMLFSFRIYDFDNDNRISREELTSMLKTSLLENGVQFSPPQIDLIIRATFDEADANRDGFIEFEEYKRFVQSHPSILSNMTLDLPRILEHRLELARGSPSAKRMSLSR